MAGGSVSGATVAGGSVAGGAVSGAFVVTVVVSGGAVVVCFGLTVVVLEGWSDVEVAVVDVGAEVVGVVCDVAVAFITAVVAAVLAPDDDDELLLSPLQPPRTAHSAIIPPAMTAVSL